MTWLKRVGSELPYALLQVAVVLCLGTSIGATVLLPVAQVLSGQTVVVAG